MTIWAVAWIAFGTLWALAFGSRAAWLAGERRRGRGRWFVFGAVLGPIGLMILDDAPPGTCASCLARVAGWSMTCTTCGEDVRTNVRIDSVLDATTPVKATGPVAQPQRTPAIAAGPSRPAAPPTTGVAPAREGVAAGIARRRAAASSAIAAAATSIGAAAAPPPPATQSVSVPGAGAPPRIPDTADRGVPPAPARPRSAPAARAPASRAGASSAETQAQLDRELRRPIRLASCVFLEGSEALVRGVWYQLTSQDGAFILTGAPGSIPNASSLSWPLSAIEVKATGDRLVVTSAPDSAEKLRLVFGSMLDWTPLGITREVDARRQGQGVDGGRR